MPPRNTPTDFVSKLDELARYLKALPASIPIGNAHNFIGYKHDAADMADMLCPHSVLNRALEISFGDRTRGPVAFKSQGLGLDAVVGVLRMNITGTDGQNGILIKWVDDLHNAALVAIEGSGNQVSTHLNIIIEY
jgi:hypothetical protein